MPSDIPIYLVQAFLLGAGLICTVIAVGICVENTRRKSRLAPVVVKPPEPVNTKVELEPVPVLHRPRPAPRPELRPGQITKTERLPSFMLR